MSRADAAARAIAEELNLAALPVDLDAAAEALGVIVVRQETDAEVDGMLIRRDGRLIAGLNSSRSAESQRFTLAHLIGHLRMHAGRELILDGVVRHRHSRLPSTPTDREEMEASRFAGALLMPEGLVRRMAAEADFGLAERLIDLLASRFGVTRGAMAYRLVALGVVLDV